MNILFKKDKYDATKVMKRFIKLINDINELKRDSILSRLKYMYYKKIKYPMFRRYIINLVKQNAMMVYDDPRTLIPVTMAFIIYLISYCNTTKTELDKLMDRLYPNGNNKILFYYDKINPKLLTKVIIISRRLSIKQKKLIQTKYRIIMDEYDCELEQIIYDCDTYENYKTADIVYHKIFRIDKLGELSNPNYILDSSIKEKEYKDYSVMALIITDILFKIMINTTKLKFYDE